MFKQKTRVLLRKNQKLCLLLPILALFAFVDIQAKIATLPPTPPPTITSFSPTNAKPGSSITLTGTNFNATPANNVVFFGATKATVTAATATSVTVIVPSGATYAPITLLNTGTKLAAYSLSNFTPTYSPAKTTVTLADFQTKQDFATGRNPQKVSAGDLDGDGKPDLVVANSGSNTVSVYQNMSINGSIGSGSFVKILDFNTFVGPSSITIGDLDGDGKLDLTVTNQYSASISVVRNTSNLGSISFATKVDFTTGSSPNSVAIGDLDGDGKPDLAVGNQSSNTVSVILNTSTSGSITFANKVDFTTGSSPYSIAIGNLNRDAKPDLVIANQGSNSVSVIRNTSTSGRITFATKIDFTTGSSPYSVAIGDLDGDGKTDLMVANVLSSSVSVIRNTSKTDSISFSAKVDFATGQNPFSVAMGDLDGDGKPDLVSANYSSNSVSVIRNTSSSGSIATNSFANKVDFATGSNPVFVAIGDLDGDVADPIWQCPITVQIQSRFCVMLIYPPLSPVSRPPMLNLVYQLH